MNEMMRRTLVGLGVRELVLRWGRWRYPPALRHVRQARVDGRAILVLANEDVGRRIALLGRYEPHDSACLARLIRPDDICFDVGANTGHYTMLMAGAAARGQVHAFEPTRLNWHLLSGGILLNGYGHARAVNCALGDRDGEVDFSEAVDGAYSSLRAVGRKAQSRIVRTTMRSLDSYVHSEGLARVDVLKVDVEGAEGLVLEGARRLLADAARRPRVVMLELVEENLRPYGLRVGDLVARMQAVGYAAHSVLPAGAIVAFDPARPMDSPNVFFLDAERTDPLPAARTAAADIA